MQSLWRGFAVRRTAPILMAHARRVRVCEERITEILINIDPVALGSFIVALGSIIVEIPVTMLPRPGCWRIVPFTALFCHFHIQLSDPASSECAQFLGMKTTDKEHTTHF